MLGRTTTSRPKTCLNTALQGKLGFLDNSGIPIGIEMKYTVDENEKGVDVSIDDVKNKKEKLLEAFQECKEGRCSCPTEEYKKMESLEVELGDQNIQLHLKSKKGLKIDKSEIEKCLAYTSKRVEEEGE